MKKKKEPGRKPLSDTEPTTSATFRMKKSQREKLRVLGGGKWVRKKIDEEDANSNG